MYTHTHTHRDRGFALIDVMIGIAIAAALITMLMATMQKQRVIMVELGGNREAVRRLETAAAAIHAGAPRPDAAIAVERLDEPCAVDGHVWSRLSTAGGRGDVAITILVDRRTPDEPAPRAGEDKP